MSISDQHFSASIPAQCSSCMASVRMSNKGLQSLAIHTVQEICNKWSKEPKQYAVSQDAHGALTLLQKALGKIKRITPVSHQVLDSPLKELLDTHLPSSRRERRTSLGTSQHRPHCKPYSHDSMTPYFNKLKTLTRTWPRFFLLQRGLVLMRISLVQTQ